MTPPHDSLKALAEETNARIHSECVSYVRGDSSAPFDCFDILVQAFSRVREETAAQVRVDYEATLTEAQAAYVQDTARLRGELDAAEQHVKILLEAGESCGAEIQRLKGELAQAQARLWDAVIAVDAIEHEYGLPNDGDIHERVDRIGVNLETAERALAQARQDKEEEVLREQAKRRQFRADAELAMAPAMWVVKTGGVLVCRTCGTTKDQPLDAHARGCYTALILRRLREEGSS
jgi:hypothetical protein